jgi:thiamine-phosphate pyrophosphorylase
LLSKLLLHEENPITDSKYIDYNNIDEVLVKVLDGGVKILQFRDKNIDDKEFLKYALQIQKICARYGCLFIINDRFEIAHKIGADGVHLGIDDISEERFLQIRDIYDGVIGISCYADIKRGVKYQNMGSDYVAFGSMFSSVTKPLAKVVPMTTIIKAKQEIDIPICVIGGINSKNIKTVVNLNIDMVAIVSDIFSQKDITEHTKKLLKAFL